VAVVTGAAGNRTTDSGVQIPSARRAYWLFERFSSSNARTR